MQQHGTYGPMYKIGMNYINIMISKRNYYEFIYMKFKNRPSYGVRIMLAGRKEQVGGVLPEGFLVFRFLNMEYSLCENLLSCTLIINAFFL